MIKYIIIKNYILQEIKQFSIAEFIKLVIVVDVFRNRNSYKLLPEPILVTTFQLI